MKTVDESKVRIRPFRKLNLPLGGFQTQPPVNVNHTDPGDPLRHMFPVPDLYFAPGHIRGTGPGPEFNKAANTPEIDVSAITERAVNAVTLPNLARKPEETMGYQAADYLMNTVKSISDLTRRGPVSGLLVGAGLLGAGGAAYGAYRNLNATGRERKKWYNRAAPLGYGGLALGAGLGAYLGHRFQKPASYMLQLNTTPDQEHLPVRKPF